MEKTEIIEFIKNDLRISHNKSDKTIGLDIDTCLADLSRVGIRTDRANDFVILQLIRLYVKASQNFQGQGSIYWDRYNDYMKAVSLNGERQKND